MEKVAVIGSISTDFVVTTAQIPAEGETVLGTSFSTFFGGKGANQAIASARSGLKTFMVGAVGNDTFGKALLNNLKNNEIDISMVKQIANSESGSAHIQVMDGDNRIIVVPGANMQLSPEDIYGNGEVLKTMDLFVLQNEIPEKTIEAAVDFATKNGIPVLYNPAPAKLISKAVLDKVTYITPNEQECLNIFGIPYKQAIQKMANKLIVTLGSKGAVYFDGEKEILVPSIKTTPIDTTGAGDTFNGYFAYGLVRGKTIEESIHLGNLAASIAIQKLGAQTGIPTMKEVTKL